MVENAIPLQRENCRSFWKTAGMWCVFPRTKMRRKKQKKKGSASFVNAASTLPPQQPHHQQQQPAEDIIHRLYHSFATALLDVSTQHFPKSQTQ